MHTNQYNTNTIQMNKTSGQRNRNRIRTNNNFPLSALTRKFHKTNNNALTSTEQQLQHNYNMDDDDDDDNDEDDDEGEDEDEEGGWDVFLCNDAAYSAGDLHRYTHIYFFRTYVDIHTTPTQTHTYIPIIHILHCMQTYIQKQTYNTYIHTYT
jgi:hypothetical protein